MTIIQRGDITFCVVRGNVPSRDQLPWENDRCDALVAILDPALLTENLARSVALRLAAMNNDWVETMGPSSEYLHDLVDRASAEIGRQAAVGDGSPMTAWHSDMTDAGAMADYVAGGGFGGYDSKLVVVIGSESEMAAFDALVESACNRPRE